MYGCMDRCAPSASLSIKATVNFVRIEISGCRIERTERNAIRHRYINVVFIDSEFLECYTAYTRFWQTPEAWHAENDEAISNGHGDCKAPKTTSQEQKRMYPVQAKKSQGMKHQRDGPFTLLSFYKEGLGVLSSFLDSR